MPPFLLALLVGGVSSVLGFVSFMALFPVCLTVGPYLVAKAARRHEIAYGLLTNTVPILADTAVRYWDECYMSHGTGCERHMTEGFLHYDLAFWAVSLLLSLIGTLPVYIGRRRTRTEAAERPDEGLPPFA